MYYAQMFAAIEASALSPESAGEYFGVSGMTLRRWRSQTGRSAIPAKYEPGVRAGMRRLMSEGKLDAEQPGLAALMADGDALRFSQTLQSIGFDPERLHGDDPVALVEGLSQLGSSPERQKQVHDGLGALRRHERRGSDWKQWISGLLEVVRSARFTPAHKLVSFGALFYLLLPFDLIPDYIPGIGLLDDMAILRLAFLFYAANPPTFERPENPILG